MSVVFVQFSLYKYIWCGMELYVCNKYKEFSRNYFHPRNSDCAQQVIEIYSFKHNIWQEVITLAFFCVKYAVFSIFQETTTYFFILCHVWFVLKYLCIALYINLINFAIRKSSQIHTFCYLDSWKIYLKASFNARIYNACSRDRKKLTIIRYWGTRFTRAHPISLNLKVFKKLAWILSEMCFFTVNKYHYSALVLNALNFKHYLLS